MEEFQSKIKPSVTMGSAVKQRSIKVKDILFECRTAIQEFNLEALLKKAKEIKFENIDEPEKEMLCTGVIKLGEALTFCRDKRVEAIRNSGIAPYAMDYANIRSYFIHHHMYYGFLKRYEILNRHIEKLGLIQELSKKLDALEKKGIDALSKEIKMGSNAFEFDYSVFFECLKNEFRLLNNELEKITDMKNLTSTERIFLNNRVRNILSIMLDLADESDANTNNKDPCKELKKCVAKANSEFKVKNEEFDIFFTQLKTYRNAVCHLDITLTKPYRTDAQLIEFIKTELQGLQQKGYLELLEALLLGEQKVNEKPQVKETVPEKSRIVPESSTIKRAKKEEPAPPKLSALQRLSVYNKPVAKEEELAPLLPKITEEVEQADEKERKKPSSSSFSSFERRGKK
jgi:hypothetical protein